MPNGACTVRKWAWGVLVLSAAPAFGAASPGPEDIPQLRPVRGELAPSFWEQYGLWVVLGSLLLLALAGLLIWLIFRPKAPAPVPPAMQARNELETLRHEPETGAVLSRVSQSVRHYAAAAFQLSAGELTTAEFCRAVEADAQVGPELSSAYANFLRECDYQKFSPSGRGGVNAVPRAEELITQSEARLARLRAEAAAQRGTPGGDPGPKRTPAQPEERR